MTPEHKEFLDQLRASGLVNMFGATSDLMDEFGLEIREARAILAEWMQSYRANP